MLFTAPPAAAQTCDANATFTKKVVVFTVMVISAAASTRRVP